MYGRVHGVAVIGIEGHLVRVEAHVGRGLPSLTLTGLPGAAVLDARERVRPAIESAGLEWPLRRVVVNLSPGNLRKEGAGFDLAIAMGVLAASAQVPHALLSSYAFAGELSLRGDLVRTPGILPIAIAAAGAGLRGVVVPEANAAEAALVDGLEVVGAPSLARVADFLRGRWRPEDTESPPDRPAPSPLPVGGPGGDPTHDLADVRGQGMARRALEIAAAGGHNVLMVGPPGAGKTMLARRLPTILPALTRAEALDVTRLHSVAGALADGALVRSRPFRSPHHSISQAGLLGGGSGFLRPGEASLAHHGVLFLDEVTEFRRDALEGLRQPLEEGRIVVARAVGAVAFPARFTLVAASNPCPCGYDGDPRRVCRCLPHRALAYRQRLSGPLLDRMDIQLAVPRLTRAELMGAPGAEPSSVVRARVEAATDRHRRRLRGTPWTCTAQVPGHALREHAALTSKAEEVLADAVDRLGLSARSFHRVLRVARTVADLEGRERVDVGEIAEALALRIPSPAEELAAS